jgi:hypothetical protein
MSAIVADGKRSLPIAAERLARFERRIADSFAAALA